MNSIADILQLFLQMFSKCVNMHVMGFFFSEAEIIWSINSKIEMLFRVVLMKHIWKRATKETSKNINARDVEGKAFVAALHKTPNEMQHLRQVGRFHKRLKKKIKERS